MRHRVVTSHGHLLAAVLALPALGAAIAQEPAPVEEPEPDYTFPGCTEAVPESLKGLRDPDSSDAARAALLERKGLAVPDLIRGLTCCDYVVRWQATDLLGMLRATEAIDPLIDRAVTDPDDHVAARAVWSLSRMQRDEEVRAKGLARLAGATTDKDRWAAAKLLARFHEPAALPAIYQALQSPDEWRRWEAVFLLVSVHDADTFDRLQPLLKDPSEQVRCQVPIALAQLDAARALPALLQMLQDASPGVRWRAAMIIANMGDARVVPALRDRLAKEQDELVRVYLNRAIDRIARRSGGHAQ